MILLSRTFIYVFKRKLEPLYIVKEVLRWLINICFVSTTLRYNKSSKSITVMSRQTACMIYTYLYIQMQYIARKCAIHLYSQQSGCRSRRSMNQKPAWGIQQDVESKIQNIHTKYMLKGKTMDWGCSSGIECLLGMPKALSSIYNTKKKKKKEG